MTLTGGQTYFFIFCITVFAVVAVRTAFAVYRIHHASHGPCSACKALKSKLDITYRIAATALAKAGSRKESNAG
jgi:hypothetical protein